MIGTDGFSKHPPCPFCEARRLKVNVKIMEWSNAPADAQVEIICDGCHKTIYEKEFHA